MNRTGKQRLVSLTCTPLWANSADGRLMILSPRFLDAVFVEKFHPFKIAVYELVCIRRLASDGRLRRFFFQLTFFEVICYLYSSMEKPVHNAITHLFR